MYKFIIKKKIDKQNIKATQHRFANFTFRALGSWRSKKMSVLSLRGPPAPLASLSYRTQLSKSHMLSILAFMKSRMAYILSGTN